MKILGIPDKTKVTEKVWQNYINSILNKKITKKQKENYNLYNGTMGNRS
jgi:hypothetical protein